uniref:Uncharacterized protein n=1 Tax=Oryza punctata TaxID=4537 RepID=A0A0E0JG15_ORYPU
MPSAWCPQCTSRKSSVAAGKKNAAKNPFRFSFTREEIHYPVLQTKKHKSREGAGPLFMKPMLHFDKFM